MKKVLDDFDKKKTGALNYQQFKKMLQKLSK